MCLTTPIAIRPQPSVVGGPQQRRSLGQLSLKQQPQGPWYLNYWLEISPQSRVVQETVEGSGIIPTIEAKLEARRDQILQQDAESTQAPGSAVSERLKTSSSMYRGALKMNGIVIDNFGTEIPRDVEELVTKHIQKAHTSPPLGEDKKASIRRKIQEVWDSPEPTVSDMITALLFDLANPPLASGRDILWSPKPLPRSTDYPLVTPKTDRHLWFQPTLKSKWTRAELAAADHPKVRPYSQPTRENLFPSILRSSSQKLPAARSTELKASWPLPASTVSAR